MKHAFLKTISPLLLSGALAIPAVSAFAESYIPSPEVLESRRQFADDRFGIFLHWGIYSMFGQGEWYLNYGPDAKEYSKAAKGFYPAEFNAKEWVSAIKDAGAKYICFTSRHHDGFSMFDTAQSDYDIMDATPFRRDILKELADECQKQGIALHLYYSHIDWTRDDYPQGRTGHDTGRDPSKADWDSYYGFMNRQLTELLTNYGPIRAIWFDGWWDHDEDATPFDWQLPAQYEMIHRLQPSCMVANNHHQTPFPGEDIQFFERDLPGENTAGLSGQEVSRLPLETCNTMNGMWGYKIKDQNYKDTKTLIQYLVKAAGMGANLLLNIGPQPSGELPATALSRLKRDGGMAPGKRRDNLRHGSRPLPGSILGNLHEEGRQTLPSCHDPGNRRHRNPRKRQNQKSQGIHLRQTPENRQGRPPRRGAPARIAGFPRLYH